MTISEDQTFNPYLKDVTPAISGDRISLLQPSAIKTLELAINSDTILNNKVPTVGYVDYKSIVTKTGTYTTTVNDHTILVDATSADVTIALPTAIGIKGKIFIIKKIDSSGNNVIIDGNLTEIIDGSETQTISVQYDSYTIQSDNANWHII